MGCLDKLSLPEVASNICVYCHMNSSAQIKFNNISNSLCLVWHEICEESLVLDFVSGFLDLEAEILAVLHVTGVGC